MSNDIAFLAEFVNGAPTRGALELAAGAVALAGQSGGEPVALAYGPGAAAGAAGLGAHGAARAVVLSDDGAPAIAAAAALVGALQSEHVELRTYRDFTREDRQRFFAMLRGVAPAASGRWGSSNSSNRTDK